MGVLADYKKRIAQAIAEAYEAGLVGELTYKSDRPQRQTSKPKQPQRASAY